MTKQTRQLDLACIVMVLVMAVFGSGIGIIISECVAVDDERIRGVKRCLDTLCLISQPISSTSLQAEKQSG